MRSQPVCPFSLDDEEWTYADMYFVKVIAKAFEDITQFTVVSICFRIIKSGSTFIVVRILFR